MCVKTVWLNFGCDVNLTHDNGNGSRCSVQPSTVLESYFTYVSVLWIHCVFKRLILITCLFLEYISISNLMPCLICLNYRLQSYISDQRMEYEQKILDLTHQLQESHGKNQQMNRSLHEANTNLTVLKDVTSQYKARQVSFFACFI